MTARIRVPSSPQGLAFAGGALWVAQHRSNTVSRIDPATNSITSTVPVTSGPDDQPARLAYGDGALWVINYSGNPGSLVRVDPATGRVVAVAKASGELCCKVAVGGGSVWVAAPDVGGGSVLRIDAASNAVVATLPGVGSPAGGNFPSPWVGAFGAGTLWIGSGSDVLRVDPATNRVTARIAVGGHAIVQAFGAGSVWVDLPNGVARIDPATNAVAARIRLPGDGREVLHWVAIDGETAWVSRVSGSRAVLWRIDVSTNAVTGSVPVGSSTDEVGDLAVGAGAVWASLFNRDTVVRVAPS